MCCDGMLGRGTDLYIKINELSRLCTLRRMTYHDEMCSRSRYGEF